MFDFEKLEVFQLLQRLNVSILKYTAKDERIDGQLKQQLREACQRAVTCLAEGTGRMKTEDKRSFYTEARSSVFSAVASLQTIRDLDMLPQSQYLEWYEKAETVSKMLLSMYRNVR